MLYIVACMWFACCGFTDRKICYGLDPWVDLREDHVGKKLHTNP